MAAVCLNHSQDLLTTALTRSNKYRSYKSTHSQSTSPTSSDLNSQNTRTTYAHASLSETSIGLYPVRETCCSTATSCRPVWSRSPRIQLKNWPMSAVCLVVCVCGSPWLWLGVCETAVWTTTCSRHWVKGEVIRGKGVGLWERGWG